MSGRDKEFGGEGPSSSDQSDWPLANEAICPEGKLPKAIFSEVFIPKGIVA